jgi:DNA-binding transcriptional MerR regulator
MTIGALAREAGVNVETVRYYERRGLLAQPERSGGGYRQYGDDALWRLQFVARAKRLGFTLSEIAELLATGDTAAVVRFANTKLDELARAIERLQVQRARLEQLVRTCTDGNGEDCTSLTVTAD